MHFPTTHWSLLARATLESDTEANRKALEELCRRYWRPVHQFIRARGISETEAQDLTQDFMVHLLEKSAFARADRLRGRFRSFLLGVLVRFLGDEADRRKAQKRGGNVQIVSFDSAEFAGQEPGAASGGESTALFDQEWALTILETALNRLRQEHVANGRESEFVVLKNFLPGGAAAPTYESGAAQLGQSVAAFKTNVHRLRRRFRALVREEVAQTVSAPHEIDAEMAHLQQTLTDARSEFRLRNET